MRIFISIVLLMCFFVSAKSQIFPVYSQYLSNGLLINPAYAGSRDVLSVSLSYRHQWLGFDGSPVTQTFSAHMPLRNKSLAVGMVVMNETMGISNDVSFFGNYAYRVHVSSGMLSFGLKAGFDLFRENDSKLNLQNPSDYVFSNHQSYWLPNFGAGLYYANTKIFAGLSVPKFLSYHEAPTGSGYAAYNDIRNYNFLLLGGGLVKLNDFFRLKPSTLIRYNINSPVQLDLNLNAILLKNGSLWIGSSYRMHDALVGIIEYQVNTQLQIGYSYDYTLSSLSNYSSGSHEVSVRYEFKYIVKALNPKFF